MSLGKRIRLRRQELGFSLRKLSSLTGLTPGFLSQVEKDISAPSLVSLQHISTALGVPMFYFHEEEVVKSSPVIRANERPKLFFKDQRIGYELLTRDMGGQTMGMLVRMQPGARRVAEPLAKPNEQWMHVLHGVLEIEINGEAYQLFSGDTISYDGNSLRQFSCVGEEELVIICCVAPPVL